MRKLKPIVAAALVGTSLIGFAGVAQAHHVFLDFEATGAQVPGGDPEGTATGTVDFNHEESDQLCLASTVEDLTGITGIQILKLEDDSVLVDFGDDPNVCIAGVEEQFEALHDFADEYRIVYFTQDFPDGAVAGAFAERPPTTTTSSTTVAPSTTATMATSTTQAAAATVTPTFTG